MRPLGILLGMVVFDFWLHLGELLIRTNLMAGEIWPYFPTRMHYDIFWTAFWGVAIILIFAELKLKSQRN